MFTEILKSIALITGTGISFSIEHKKSHIGSKYIDSFSMLKSMYIYRFVNS